jgi:hypothetical protein
MNLSPPSTQKAEFRPISFVLDDGGATTSVDLVIRPEDLTRSDPSRVSVQQTLGASAWADNFGPGLPQITISGHTGWRRTESDSDDGVARFQKLNDLVFTQWHEKRKEAAKSGSDPDNIQLIFSDALDGFSVVVVPMGFTLRRSRSRPLLCQYQISMTVVNSAIDQLGYLSFAGSSSSASVTESLGLDSLTASVNRITSMLTSAKNFINGTMLTPVQKFMTQTARLYSAVHSAISAGTQIAGSLISIAKTTAQAGINIFRTLAAVASIPTIVRSQLMQVAAAYSNILCVLSNALRKQKYIQDYSDLYGSSNCSSTSGGRPLSTLSGVNPFYSVVPTGAALPVSVTTTAQKGLVTLANSDPVLSPLSTTSLGNAIRDVSSGLVVTA